MKKQLLKITLLAVVMLFGASAIQAQNGLWTKNAFYKIGAGGTDLFMTINGETAAVEWQKELPNDDPTQVWAIVDHVTPASAGLMQITAEIPGVGTFTLASNTVDPGPDATTAQKRDITIISEFRSPMMVEMDDFSGKDQFQRRKTKVDANGDADSDGAVPAGGNNALFIKVPWDGGSRFGAAAVEGEAVKFDNGAIDVINFKFVKDLPAASVNTFNQDAFVISNPVSNQLSIKGATSEVNQVNVYSLLGNTVLSEKVNNVNGDINLNVADLSTGLYIVEVKGTNGQRLTKKVIKQ